jgi:hypothetical protein
MCGYCDIQNVAEEPTPFDTADLNSLINNVWNGLITKHKLPVELYNKTSGYLINGLNKGFDSTDKEMLADLSNNIYVFSGAKTYQQVRSLTTLLADPELKSNFYKFKDKATPIVNEFDRAYMQAEWQTAVGSGRMAGYWSRIQEDKDILPLLEYDTVGDGRVRPEHAVLDKIIRPVGDKFWDTLYPPNGWRCRCTVRQLSEGTITDLRGKSNLYNNVPESFRMNAGKDRVIFKEKGPGKHPYFSVAKGDKEYAKRNFDLPIPKL